jgi:NAD(P)-dependent dehydrogenase (short-subunit alcohol dehydrogenase family)
MTYDFGGKVVLIAGGTGGLGKAVSLAFLRGRAKVVVTYRNENEFAALKADAQEDFSLLSGYAVDVTDEEADKRLVGEILAQHGGLDILVNTVGGYAGGVSLWDLETKVFDHMLNLNLRSGYSLARAVLPGMLSRKSGVIVNVAAKAAVDHGKGASAYAASKAAAVALMDSLAEDTKGLGIRVNSVLPSIIDTAVNRQAMPGSAFDDWPKPGDIARVISFLCSDDAKVIHGASIPVYGDR